MPSKHELLGNCSDYECFIKTISDWYERGKSLQLMYSVGIYNSSLLSYHQKNRVESFVKELDGFLKDLQKFEYFGELGQQILGF